MTSTGPTGPTEAIRPNDLDAYWMPFTASPAVKQSPRLLACARDMHCFTPDGRALLDGTAGFWGAHAGHLPRSYRRGHKSARRKLDFAGTLQIGHPKTFALASRIAALAPGDLNRGFFEEDLFARALQLEPVWVDAVHSLKGLPNVLDIRTLGLSAAIDLLAKPGAPGKRGFDAMDRAFHDFDLLLRSLRSAGDTLILTPPLIVSEAQTGEIVEKTARAIKSVA